MAIILDSAVTMATSMSLLPSSANRPTLLRSATSTWYSRSSSTSSRARQPMTVKARGWMAGLFWNAVLATRLIHRARHALATSTDGAATEHVSNRMVARFSVAASVGPASWLVDIDAPSRMNVTVFTKMSLLGSDSVSMVARSLLSRFSSSANDVQAEWIELISSRCTTTRTSGMPVLASIVTMWKISGRYICACTPLSNDRARQNCSSTQISFQTALSGRYLVGRSDDRLSALRRREMTLPRSVTVPIAFAIDVSVSVCSSSNPRLRAALMISSRKMSRSTSSWWMTGQTDCSSVNISVGSESVTSMSFRKSAATFSLPLSLSDSLASSDVRSPGIQGAMYARLRGFCSSEKLSHPTKNSFRKSSVSCGSVCARLLLILMMNCDGSSGTDMSRVLMSFDAAVNLNALHSAPSRLYDDSLSTGSALARLVRARFSSVPGTSCGRISRSNDFIALVSLPYFALAARMACSTSDFLGLVKYMTILPLSALRPKAESSSVWIEVGASSMSPSRKMSFTVVLMRKPGTSCFLVVVTCTNWLPTLITTSILPLDLDSLVTGWKT